MEEDAALVEVYHVLFGWIKQKKVLHETAIVFMAIVFMAMFIKK